MTAGIYQIKNKRNGKIYIGSAVNIKRRWNEHKSDLKLNKHHSAYLQNSYNKHGEHNFIFETLEIVQDKTLLVETEQRHMDATNCYNREIGYNISPTAGNCLGVKHSPESKKKMSEAKTGEKNHMFGRTGENSPNFGKTGEKSPLFGKKCPEHSRKISGENHYFFGKKRPEHSQKMSGDRNPNSKLIWPKVNEIRRKYKEEKTSHRKLAKEYGVSKNTIGYIVRNETWRKK